MASPERAELVAMLEVWAKWIGDECAEGMEDTTRQLCAIDLRRAAECLARGEDKPRRSDECRACNDPGKKL